MFISHDLSLVRLIADRVAVMYQASVVEEAETSVLFADARHPYTQALLDVIPIADPRRRDERIRKAKQLGAAADGDRPSAGCAYAPRCPHAMDACWSEPPELRRLDDGTAVRCHLHASTPVEVAPAGPA